MNEIKLRKDQVRLILMATFPEYKGKIYKLVYQENYHPQNYWDGGTRRYFRILEKTGDSIKLLDPGETFLNPFLRKANAQFEIQRNWAVVEHTIYCGKDLGITIYVHPFTSLFSDNQLPHPNERALPGLNDETK